MSILSRLWRYVHTNGYPLPSASAFVPHVAPSGRRARGRAVTPRLEYMEQRLLMTTLFAGEQFLFTNARNVQTLVQINGSSTVTELIAATQDGDGSLLFGDLEGEITTGPRAGQIVGNGAIPVSGGYQGSAQLQTPSLPKLNVGGISSNQAGATFAFNATDLDDNGNVTTVYPITGDLIPTMAVPPATTTPPIPYDVTLFGIANSNNNPVNNLQAGQAYNPSDPANTAQPYVDLSNVLEGIDGGTISNGTEPELLGATKVKIAGAAFNPVDGLLYFDLQYTPAANTSGTGTSTTPVEQDVLYSIDPTAAGNDVAGTTTLTRIGNLDIRGGAYSIGALTFKLDTAGSATLITYVNPASASGNSTLGFTPEAGVETYTYSAGAFPTTTNNNVTSVTPDANGYGDVLLGYQPQATTPVYLSNVTGIAVLPATIPGANGNYLFATNGNELVRINLTGLQTGTRNNHAILTSSVFGSTTDENEIVAGKGAPYDGNQLVGLTYNPNVIDPFTGTRGVLESYDSAFGSSGANGSRATQDTVFVSDRLRISQGDIFAVYTNQSNISDSISIQDYTVDTTSGNVISLAYSGSAGTLNTLGNFTTVTIPTAGGGYLGFLGTVPGPAGTPIHNQPFLSGTTDNSIGIYPGDFTTTLGGTPVDTILPGLVVGYGLEQGIDVTESLLDQTLGNNFTSANGLAISRDGTVAVIDSTANKADQFAFVDEATGAIDSAVVTVKDGAGNSLSGNQGIAYGSVNLDGTESLYAIYDINFNDGNGLTPTLGIITPQFNGNTLTGAVFTPVGTTGLGLSNLAAVEGLAFSPGSTPLDPSHQGLYIIADTNVSDSDISGKLYQVNPLTGQIYNTTGLGTVTAVDGATVLVGSATFNAAGQLLVFDKQSGRLLDVNLTTAVAGANIRTQSGTINPTVGGIALDPTTGQLYAIDNETTYQGDGSQLRGGGNPILGSSVLVEIRNPAVANNSAVNLGEFLFDGTVTGRVFISGSMTTFYAGWLVTGDAGDGSSYINNGTSDATLLTQNFYVGGDIGNLLSYASIGTDGVLDANGLPTYTTGFDLIVNGKLGTLNTDGAFAGHTLVEDNTGIPNVPDNGDPENAVQQETQYYETQRPLNSSIAIDFANGLLVANGVAPFSDQTFATAQYLGTIRNQVTGQPDVVDLDGQIFGVNSDNSAGPDPVDYYGVSLLAGQTIVIQVADLLGVTQLGIFDPEDRLIATDLSDVDPTAVSGQPITLTATEAGVYRIAVAESGDNTFTVPSGASPHQNATYNLTISGLGDLAIGGIVSGGSMILTGAPSSINHGKSIEAVRGDIGAVVAGQQRFSNGNGDAIIAPHGTGYLAFTQASYTSTASYNLVETPSEDLSVDNGSFRAVVAGSVDNTTEFSTFSGIPDIYVPNGTFGLLQTTGTGATDILAATFGFAAGGDIQHIDSAANIAGVYRTNKGFGVIEAANFTMGTLETEFHANVDGIGNDGIIDLISTPGDFGVLTRGGPAIITGAGGNVRFMHVGGDLYQDFAFGNGGTALGNGFVQQATGPVAFTDDSGAKVVLTPGQVETTSTVTDSTTGLTSTLVTDTSGTLITRTYGIRGSGGVVILNVISNSGLTVSATTSGAAVGTAEIGQIDVGVPITINGVSVVNTGNALVVSSTGAPALPDLSNTTTTSNSSVLSNLTLVNPTLAVNLTGGRVDVYNITNTSALNNTTGGGTIDSITNSTGGDILNIDTEEPSGVFGDIGTLNVSAGNIGSTSSNSGQTVAAYSNVIPGGNAYPFNNQHVGIVAANIATISAGKSVGNIIANKVIGTITANTLGNTNPALFYGINGPIVALGGNTPPGTSVISLTNPFPNATNNGTSSVITNANGTTTTVTPNANGTFTVTTTAPDSPGLNFALPVSIVQVNIGNGILSSGNGASSKAGIYATDTIANVTGSNADIRGNIVSLLSIGNITLTNGSIINSDIRVVGTFASSIEYAGAFVSPRQVPVTPSTPFYELGNITLNGDGGILGSYITASDIGKITVNAGGFGILNSTFIAAIEGTINTQTAAGYGFRNDTYNSGNLLGLIATGNGAAIPFTAFDPGVQPSQPTDTSYAASNTGFEPNPLIDLESFIDGDVTTGQAISPSGLTSGVIENVTAEGAIALGTVSAYELVGSDLAFANSTGAITITGNIMPYVVTTPGSTLVTATGGAITTGSLKSLTVGGSVIEFDLSVAGKTGPISIGGNLAPYVNANATISGTSELFIKGPSGDLTSLNVYGSVSTGANIIVQGVAGSIVIGSANKTGVSTGDFSGNLTIDGDHPAPVVLSLLEIFGAILGGNFDILGNVGTINVAHSLTSDFTVAGTLGSLLVGTDPFHSGDVLGGTFTVEGNVGNITVTGASIGTVLVEGTVTNLNLYSDGASANLVAIGSTINTQGGITNLLISGGNVAGAINSGTTLAKGIINGSIVAGGSVTSSLGNITSLTVNGNVGGAINAPNGNIATLAVNGSFLANSSISANSLTKLTVPGSFGGNLTVTSGLANATFGSIAAGAVIEANFIGGLRTGGDSLGNISSAINNGTKASILTIGGSMGGTSSFGSPLTITVGGNINPGASLSEAGSLTSLKVGGTIFGDITVGGQIVSLTAGAASGAVITSGFGITKATIKGAVTSSIIQTGIAPGNDGIFGTADLGEQSRMADITTLTVGGLTASIVAAGGNIGTFKSGSTLINSSVSSGLVLGGANIEAVITGAAPLNSVANLNTARIGATLYSGNIGTATVGGSGLVNSALTAGVSAGADGVFNPNGSGDDTVSNSLTGGTSGFRSVKANADSTSAILSASGGGTVIPYTLTNGVLNSITGTDPLGTLAATAIVGAPAIYSDGLGNTLQISVVGAPGATVSVYGSGDAPNIVITGAGTKPLTVNITTSTPGVLNLGRVLTTDGTQLGTFITNAFLVGDGVNTVPQLWIDSAMTTFTVAGFATNGTTNNAAWSGQIGGAVKNFTVGVQGPGALRIGGAITNLNVGSSTGNSLLQQLGTSAIGGITNIATNTAGVTYAYSGGYVFSIDPTTGAVLSAGSPVHTATGAGVGITGLDFNGSGTLYGVGSVNNQSPTVPTAGKISIGDQLHGLAINPLNGLAYAVNTDVVTGQDELISIDPTTGVGTVVGPLQDAFSDTFSGNVLALAFSSTGALYGIINDRDGSGSNYSTTSGDVFVQIATSDPNDTGSLRVSNPSPNGNALSGLFITRGGTNVVANYTGLVADPVNAGVFYATRVVGGVTTLDRITLTTGSTPSASTVVATTLGVVSVNGTNTSIVGLGFDENNNLIGLDENGTNGDLVDIIPTTPTASQYITAPQTIPNNLAAFAVSTTGTIHTTFAYTTDASLGGNLYSSPGVVSTLGSIDPTTGLFSERGALTQDAAGTPLAGTVTSIAVNKTSGIVTVLTSNGVLAQYSDVNGSLIGGKPLGTIVDGVTHQRLDITHIVYDSTGRLVGIDATNHRLDAISTTPVSLVVNGQSITALIATALTEVGTASASDLAAFDFAPTTNTFLAYDSALNAFVSLLGINDNSLGGIIAPSITTLNIGSGTYAGRINATGVGVGNSITTINARTAGVFQGDIVTAGSIGTFTRYGEFDGTVLAGGDFKTASISGDVLSDGTLVTSGTFGTVTVSGTLLGSILANNATALSIGTLSAGGDVNVIHNLAAISLAGTDAGTIQAGTTTTFTARGQLLAGSSTTLTGDAASVFLYGGTNAGSTFIEDGNISKTLVVGGTLGGTVAARLSVAAATLTNLVDGLFSVGNNLTTLTVAGSTFDSLISVGTWVGFDGIYNTDDDTIYGGSLGTAKFAGVFTDSAITAGVLPSESTTAGPANNIPADNNAFNGNPSAVNVTQINSAQSGGIALSTLGNLTFSRGVVSTDTGTGNLSVAVASNGIGKVVNGVNLTQAVVNTPTGQLAVATDPTTGTALISRASSTEILIAFNKPIDTSTLTAANISVIDTSTGDAVSGITIGYYAGFGTDGVTKEYFVSLVSTSSLPSSIQLIIRNLTDNFGTRTALLDFNQDGIDTTNPFSPAPANPIVDTQI